VYIAAPGNSQSTIDALKTETRTNSVFSLDLDLSDLTSIKAAAEKFIRDETRLHTLYNNG
jgi:retinol dehydrogenase 12